MAATELDDLLIRVEKLEKQNRRLKRLGLVLGLVLATGLLVGAQDKPAKKTVEANRISLHDDDGAERGHLTVTPEGLGIIYTGGGAPSAGLVVGRNGVLMQQLDGTGRPLTGVSVHSNGIDMGYRSSKVGTDSGTDAIRDVTGLSLQASPLLAKPGAKP